MSDQKRQCNDRVMYKLINYFALPLIAVLVFIFLSWKPVDDWLIKNIPNYTYRFITKCLILFTTVYIANRLLVKWKFSMCTESIPRLF